QLAHLETSVGPGVFAAAVGAASLVRDRELAVRDARRLLAAARTAGVDPVGLVPAWRRERRFLVEQPALQAVSPRLEAAALRRVPGVLHALRLAWLGGPAADAGAPEAGAPDTAALR